MKSFKKGILVLGFFLGLTSLAWSATPMDVLLDKLVAKGVLTEEEAREVKQETIQEGQRGLKQAEGETLPRWVQKIKLKGDMRLRYQFEKKKSDTEPRNRGRIRYRLGWEAQVGDQVKVAAGLASGSSDPRSTNQTFDSTFDTPDVRLDYAYVEYSPFDGLRMAGGKHKRKPYLWQPTDLLWDGDINPEGFALHAEKALTDDVKGFLNSGVWVLDENGKADKPDPFMHFVQAGLKAKKGLLDARLAGTYYGFNGLKGQNLAHDSCTNSGLSLVGGSCTGGGLTFDYDAGQVSVEVGMKEPFGGLPWDIDQRVAVFGDYVKNADPSEQDTGYAVGVKFGNKKVKEAGDWQAKYIFARLAKDAWPDFLPDSDRFFGGGTNGRGHEVALTFGLTDHVSLGLDYYYDRTLKGNKDSQHLVQGDLLFKF